MKTLFLLARLLTGLMVGAGLVLLFGIVLLRSAGSFAKESLGILVYLVELLTSGFTQGTSPQEPAGWVVSWPQVALASLFLAMAVSLFLPDAKLFLHITTAMAGVVLLGLAWWMRNGLNLEVLCLPSIAVWFAYYTLNVLGKPGTPPLNGTG